MKKIIAVVKLHIPAGKALPTPPVGPALAQRGVKIGDFCQQFNEATKNQEGFTIPTEVTVYEDKSFSFRLKSPLTSELLKKAAGIEKGSGIPNQKKMGKISRDELRKIAKQKMTDLNTNDIEAAERIIAGTAKQMGIEIE